MRLIDADKIVNYEVESEMSIDKDNCGMTKFVLIPVEHLSDIPTDDMAMQAVEKQIPKKIFRQGYEYEGKMIYPVGINGVPYDLCPSCKTNLCTDGFLGRDKRKMKYCENCGQKLDWTG